MNNIHKDSKYKKLKDELDRSIHEFAQYVNEFANEDDPIEPQTLLPVGWTLSIAVTGYSEDGSQFDDLLPEASEGLSNYTAEGMLGTHLRKIRDLNDGYIGEEEED